MGGQCAVECDRKHRTSHREGQVLDLNETNQVAPTH